MKVDCIKGRISFSLNLTEKITMVSSNCSWKEQWLGKMLKRGSTVSYISLLNSSVTRLHIMISSVCHTNEQNHEIWEFISYAFDVIINSFIKLLEKFDYQIANALSLVFWSSSLFIYKYNLLLTSAKKTVFYHHTLMQVLLIVIKAMLWTTVALHFEHFNKFINSCLCSFLTMGSCIIMCLCIIYWTPWVRMQYYTYVCINWSPYSKHILIKQKWNK